MNPKKILVPVDYSECSSAALAFAATMARAFGAKLDIVSVWDRPEYVSETVLVRQADGRTRTLLDMIRQGAESALDEFVTAARLPPGLLGERRLLAGHPAARILGELESGRYDLVVVGTHGRSGLRHLLLGSVAEKLVRLSPVPVITVPPPEGAPP